MSKHLYVSKHCNSGMMHCSAAYIWGSWCSTNPQKSGARRKARGATRWVWSRSAKDTQRRRGCDEMREAAPGCGLEEQLFRFRLTITYFHLTPAASCICLSQGRTQGNSIWFEYTSNANKLDHVFIKRYSNVSFIHIPVRDKYDKLGLLFGGPSEASWLRSLYLRHSGHVTHAPHPSNKRAC